MAHRILAQHLGTQWQVGYSSIELSTRMWLIGYCLIELSTRLWLIGYGQSRIGNWHNWSEY